jgi:nucleoside-diphosphate-sugar epimerase
VRVLLTGGAGFIGSHLAERLLARGHEVAIVDNFSTGKRENLPDSAVLCQADIRSGCDLAKIFKEFEPEVLAHQAAQIDVRRSVRVPDFDADINVIATIRLLQNCVEHGVGRVVFASTGGAIYGDQGEFPVTEDRPQYPVSPYGVLKLASERYLHHYSISTVTLRYSNVYGPRQDPHGEAGVVAIFCANLVAGRTSTINGYRRTDARLRLRRGCGPGQRPRPRERGDPWSVQHRYRCRDERQPPLRSVATNPWEGPSSRLRTRQAWRTASQLGGPCSRLPRPKLAAEGNAVRGP